MFFTRKTDDGQPRRKHGCLRSILIFMLFYFGSCLLLGIMMESMFSTPVATLEDNTVYRLSMKGTLVEQAVPSSPLEAIMKEMPGYSGGEVVGLDNLLSNIQLAKTDDRIKGILLDGGELAMGPASAKALRDALVDFKQSGKFLLAYADSYGQVNYYVASAADKVMLNPTGSVDWNGLGGEKMYYTRLLQKLGIEMQILKVGTFKSAVEPYFRTSMSEADRQQTMQYLNGIWDEMKQAVGASRGIAPEQLHLLANDYMGLQPQERYLQEHLVDTLIYPQSVDSILRIYTGTKDFHLMRTDAMATVKRAESKAQNQIAVVYAEGDITDSEGDGIVGTKMVKTLNDIRKDKQVKAVVLRVSSPGGSADASEQIWHAVQLLREKGLPVVVSMGDYAASGGYYISCGADYIYAEPTTITGSIGIFGTIPNLRGIREKVGLDVDMCGTNTHSGMESSIILNGMTPAEQALFQAMIERGYDLFTRRCAEGRHVTQDDIKKVAEGRVWLGKDALQIGLVDAMGNMQNAIDKAAELAALDSYKLTYYPEKSDPMEELLKLMSGEQDEEAQLIAKVRAFCDKPRVMARMDDIRIR